MRTAFYDKKITVVGLARSGVGAANLLAFLGAEVTVTDRKECAQLEDVINALDPRVSTVIGSNPPELFTSSDLVVVSPGVPSDVEPLRAARSRGIRVIGELELAYEVLHSAVEAPRPEILAITGTNGKSTTTALLYEMVGHADAGSILAGNIGNSVAAEIQGLLERPQPGPAPKFIVVELSSFQLETIEAFRPKGSAILNVTPDHLDRYHGMAAYMDAKIRISMNQRPSDFIVLNADDPLTPDVLGGMSKGDDGPAVFYFSRKKKVEGVYLDNGLVRFNLPASALSRMGGSIAEPYGKETLDPETFIIRGVHNIENAMAAALMACLAGCSMRDIRRALSSFPGLEHRLELVRELDGVRYINDSKGTNVGAVLKSLEGFSEPVILIAGGKDKAGDFSLLKPLLSEKVKRLVLVGAAAEKIRSVVSDVVDCEMTGYDFGAAIAAARAAASAGDVVLLSPACASFDMFTDFEDRGRQFRRMVMEL
jgi:UDP-N-acetylmuramoylalanine--D-glutamate ligase